MPEQQGRVRIYHDGRLLGTGQLGEYAILAPERLIAWGLPLSFAVLVSIVWLGENAGWLMWALFCVSSTFVALSQPAVALALPAEAAGRALSAYNLAIFAGVFVVQWGIGLLIDALALLGWKNVVSPNVFVRKSVVMVRVQTASRTTAAMRSLGLGG